MVEQSEIRGKSRHEPVLLTEVLEALGPRERGIYVDGTFGAGGYARAILQTSDCAVYAIDRDAEALAAGAELAAAFPGRLTLIEGLFSNMDSLLALHGVEAVDGIVLDVGVSSMQLDDPARGFSFRSDGPLDMRMGRGGETAADAVNMLSEDELKRIIAVFGEERRAHAIARAIVRTRALKPFTRTGELARLVESVIGRKPQDPIHPATRTFQALRIYVNRELDELVRALGAAEKLLKPAGRLAVVCFHSLEDRIVKKFLAERSGHAARPSRHRPAVAMPRPTFMLLTRNPVTPSEAEVEANPRSRSAKLRAAVRTDAPARPLTRDLLLLASSGGRA
jgi:16S rRNA (cytosine1402-N4)-methyltransferase